MTLFNRTTWGFHINLRVSQDASHVPGRFVDLFGDGDGKKEDVVQPCLAVTINPNRIYHVIIIYEHTQIYIYIIYIYIYAYIYMRSYLYHTISQYLSLDYLIYIYMISLVLFYCGVKTQRITLLTHRCNKSQLQGHLNHPLGYLQPRKTSICFFVGPKISYIYISTYVYIYICLNISIYIPMIYHYSHQPWNSPLFTTKKHGICSPYTSSTIATALCPATSRAPPAREHWRSRRSPPGPVETPRAPGELEVSTWRIYGWYMVNIYIYIYECIDV